MGVISPVEARSEEGVREAVPAGYLPLLRGVEAGDPLTDARSQLVDRALDVWARPGFETFVSLPRLRFEPFDYQLRAAATALRRMRGRAILADEVGLGKTIEAGLVLSELRLRGLADRTLVLAPAGLLRQWREELDRKFALPSLVLDGSWPGEDPPGEPVLIASISSARRPPLKDHLAGSPWDLVIVDEAHRLKNPRSASARLARSLRTRYLLLLTATPVENRLDELFHVVSLVAPGLLGTIQEFRSRHGAAVAPHSRGVRDPAGLRLRLQEVMVRHRRSEVAQMLPRRLAETVRVAPAPEEAELYRRVSERVRAEGRAAPPSRALALRSLQRLAGSSPAAAAPLLARLGWHELAGLSGRQPPTEKARALLSLLYRHVAAGEKVAVFTAFRETLSGLEAMASEAGIPAAIYHGSLPRQAKEGAIESFAGDVPVLLTTEAAGEGRNLQFCRVLVNFDLPWNPMQIEQRLGRVHRIGQSRDVLLTNLVSRGTLEDRMLGVLEAKINLFELVVGELDMILGRIEDDFDFESFLFRAHVDSDDDDELARRLETLGDQLARARREYLAGRHAVDGLVGEER